MTGECQLILFDPYLSEYESILTKQNRSWTENIRKSFKINPPTLVSNKEDVFYLIRNSSSCLVGLKYIPHKTTIDPICNIEIKVFPSEIPFSGFGFYHTLHHLVAEIDKVLTTEPFYNYYDNRAVLQLLRSIT